jgi:hypothetical protein
MGFDAAECMYFIYLYFLRSEVVTAVSFNTVN